LIDGGVERWRELKMSKSSAQLLEILLDELSASHSGPDTFTGKVKFLDFRVIFSSFIGASIFTLSFI